MSKVKVYYFEGYDIAEDQTYYSQRMATLEWIKNHYYTPIMKTAKEIEDSSFEPDGLYREIPRIVRSSPVA